MFRSRGELISNIYYACKSCDYLFKEAQKVVYNNGNNFVNCSYCNKELNKLSSSIIAGIIKNKIVIGCQGCQFSFREDEKKAAEEMK